MTAETNGSEDQSGQSSMVDAGDLMSFDPVSSGKREAPVIIEDASDSDIQTKQKAITDPSLINSLIQEEMISPDFYQQLYEAFVEPLKKENPTKDEIKRFKGLILDAITGQGTLTMSELANVLAYMEQETEEEAYNNQIIRCIKEIQSSILKKVPVALLLALAIQNSSQYQAILAEKENVNIRTTRTQLLGLVTKLLETAFLTPALKAFVTGFLAGAYFVPIKEALENYAKEKNIPLEKYNDLLYCRRDVHEKFEPTFVEKLQKINATYFSNIQRDLLDDPSKLRESLKKICSTVNEFNLAMMHDKSSKAMVGSDGKKYIAVIIDGAPTTKYIELVRGPGCRCQLGPVREDLPPGITLIEVPQAYKGVVVEGKIVLYEQILKLFEFLNYIMVIFINEFIDTGQVGLFKGVLNYLFHACTGWRPFNDSFGHEDASRALRLLLNVVMAMPMSHIIRDWYDETQVGAEENDNAETSDTAEKRNEDVTNTKQLAEAISASLVQDDKVKGTYTLLHARLMRVTNEEAMTLEQKRESSSKKMWRKLRRKPSPAAREKKSVSAFRQHLESQLLSTKGVRKIEILFSFLSLELSTYNRPKLVKGLVDKIKQACETEKEQLKKHGEKLLNSQGCTQLPDEADTVKYVVACIGIKPLLWVKSSPDEKGAQHEKSLFSLAVEKNVTALFDLDVMPSLQSVRNWCQAGSNAPNSEQLFRNFFDDASKSTKQRRHGYAPKKSSRKGKSKSSQHQKDPSKSAQTAPSNQSANNAFFPAQSKTATSHASSVTSERREQTGAKPQHVPSSPSFNASQSR